MKKLTKRILAFAISLAMVVTSIAYFDTKAKADPIEITINVALEQSNSHQLRVTWTNPQEVIDNPTEYHYGYYVNTIGQNNQCQAANGYVWGDQYRTMLDTVSGTNGGISFSDGGDFSIIVVITKDGNTYAQGQSTSIHIDEDTNTNAAFKLDRYEQSGANTVCSWTTIGGAHSYLIKNKDTGDTLATVNSGSAQWTQWATPTSTVLGDTYTCQLIAKDSNGDPISITNNEITLDYLFVGSNYNAQFTLDEYINIGASAKCSWQSITGATSYIIKNKDTGDTLTTVAGNVTQTTFTSPTSTVVDDQYTCQLIAMDTNGDVISITNNEIKLDYYLIEENINAAFKLDRYEESNTHTVCSWRLIDGATSYKAFNEETGDLLFKTNTPNTWFNFLTPVSTTQNDTYKAILRAYDENGNELLIRNNEITLNYNYVTVPSEHVNADFSSATWEEFQKYGSESSSISEKYYINSDNGLNKFFWGVYAPHTEIPYHSERGQCDINGAAISVQWTNVRYVWINSVAYHNPSNIFNNQGDCVEMSLNVFKPGINVVTFVMIDGSLKTFGIKTEGSTTHEIRIDNTKVADVFEGQSYRLPSYGMTEYSQYGYYLVSDNSKVYAPGDFITVNGDLSFSGIDTISVSHTNGAIIRMVKEEPGIAFQATIRMNNQTPIFNKAFNYGMIISTYDFFVDRYEENLTLDNTRKEVNCLLTSSSQWNNGTFYAGVLNLQKTNFTRDFVSRAYVKINYADGESLVVYASNPTDTTNRVRNLKLIAQRTKAATDYYNSLEPSEREAIDYFCE